MSHAGDVNALYSVADAERGESLKDSPRSTPACPATAPRPAPGSAANGPEAQKRRCHCSIPNRTPNSNRSPMRVNGGPYSC